MSSDVYGAIFGSAAKTWITIEDVHGLRIGNGSTVKLQLDTSGAATFLAGHVTIADPNGIEIAAGASGIANPYGYTWGTAFSGTNQVGVFAYESGGTARSLYLYNATTQAASFADAVLFASANAGTSAVFSVIDDHRSGSQQYASSGAPIWPSFDNLYDLGSTSLRWANIYMAGALNFDGSGNVSLEEDLAGRLRIGGTTSGTTSYLGWDGVQLIPFDDGTKNLGHGSFRWNTLFATNATINTSDARLKTDIQPSAYGLAFIRQLRPVDYRWRDRARGEGVRTGLLAQDVAAIAPAFGGLHYDAAGVADGLAYDALVAPLVRAVQELAATVEEMQTHGR